MKVELTDKKSGKKIAVDIKLIRLVEPIDGGGTHLAFDEAMGREVVEEYDKLKSLFDVVAP